ncbi:hypothetical protein WN943_026876 [Citrus x changshan-huyou]
MVEAAAVLPLGDLTGGGDGDGFKWWRRRFRATVEAMADHAARGIFLLLIQVGG